MPYTSKADSIRAHITRDELVQLCILRMASDPLPANVDVDVLDDFLDRASNEMGFVGWVDCYHQGKP